MDKPTILVVDDSQTIQTAVSLSLNREKYKVIAAASPEQAWNILTYTKPDLILSDTSLPDKNAFEFYQELKQDENLKKIPVVFLTGKDLSEEQFNQIKSDGKIKKPFQANELVSLVETVLSKEREDGSAQAFDVTNLVSEEDLSPEIKEKISTTFAEENLTKLIRQDAKELIEKICWEVIPPLAEKIIKEEISQILKEDQK